MIAMDTAPKILEIGDYQLMREGYPDSVEHWSTQMTARSADLRPGGRLVTLTSLPRLARALASDAYDLVVVQPNSFAPWQWRAISRSLFRRSVLSGSLPYARHFGQQMVRGRVHAPVAVWDWDEPSFIPRQNVFLLDAATLYFKRELPPDHWRVFMGTVHYKVPTPRFRTQPRQRERIAKLRPISLGVPLGYDRNEAARPLPDGAKTADIFFTGRVRESTTVRQRGLQELFALREQGVRVDIPDGGLPHDQFLRRCASAWLTWSPEGFGYECFRTYEAALCGSVPILNRQTIERHAPLRDGEHCFYYDVEPGGLTATVKRALQDRDRLARMAVDARAHVLAEHTHAKLARHIAETTLAAHRGIQTG